MSKSKKLSASEVAALVGGLSDFDSSGEQTEGGVEIRSYKFGTNDLSILGDYYALRMINERFCRIARSVFLPMLRFQPRISSFPPEMKSFDDYSDSLENFVSLTISRIEELRGTKLIVIPPSFVSLLTESYYGGKIAYQNLNRSEFTATEHRVIEIVTNGINQSLELAWRDLTRLTLAVQSREENLQFASFVENEEMVVNCSFMVQLPDTDHASFDILYPLQTLKPLAAQLRSRMQSDLVDDDMSWRERLEDAVLSVPLEMSARLAEPDIPIKSLMKLKPGETIPLNLKPDPHLLVEDQPIFNVEFGELGNKSAVSLLSRRDNEA